MVKIVVTRYIMMHCESQAAQDGGVQTSVACAHWCISLRKKKIFVYVFCVTSCHIGPTTGALTPSCNTCLSLSKLQSS